MRRVSLLVVMMVTTLGLGAAAGQDSGRVGLVMGYPASVGLLWQVSDRVAIRPEVQIARSAGENTSGNGVVTSSSSSWTGSFGASALIYMGAADTGLRTYFSPRFLYSRLSSESSLASTAGLSSGESTGNSYSVYGSFGAEYALGKRFAVFGEVGLGYSRTSQTGSQTSPVLNDARGSSTSNAVATRTAAGVICYF